MKRWLHIILLVLALPAAAQINVERTLQVGRNALYFEDYMLAIQYFNQAINAKPYLAEPYFLRAIAKYNLEDFAGARADATQATDVNPFLPDAWEVRGVANQCLGDHVAAIADYDHALALLPYNRQILFNKALAQEQAKLYAGADSTYATLLEAYPGFDGAYVGRAQLRLQQGDTIAARTNLTKALEINANSVEALTLRAALTPDDPQAALADMERAVTLQPNRAYLRVNRAVARYLNHDFNGALNDFDYVLEQDPMNYTALFNRAMLRAEIKDNDRAVADLDRALQLRPDDLRARFNRAVILNEKRQWDAALADVNAVIEAYPEMYAGYVLRGQIYNESGREREANADWRRAMAIAHTAALESAEESSEELAVDETAATINRFKALQTVDEENGRTAQTFHTEGMRSRIQERKAQVEPQPIYQLSYYTADDADAPGIYDKEIEDLNSARVLPFVVFLTNNLPQMTREADSQRHFESIQRLGALINSGKATPLDRFARAMDYMTLKDYNSAIADLDALLAAQPDFAPGYLMRAAALYRQQESEKGRVIVDGDAAALNAEAAMLSDRILTDLDRALDRNPRMAVALYNKGVLLMQLGAYSDAIDDFTRAIELNPDLGAAYYNRGYIHFSRGNRTEALRDLSRAGQLGVSAAYPLLKLMQL